MATVGIHGINKSYGPVPVVHDVSLEIEDSEFAVLVGPSGCGKSTLLRMIAGLEDITAGRISIDGNVVNDLLPKERDIAMVFQNYALYPHMTVAENMGFSLRLRRANRKAAAAKVEEAAQILGLEKLLDRYPKQLSGGQRQRVAMGRAIVRDPKVFLFDEPLSNLDAKLRVQMRLEIRELQQRLKTTTIYVTHDQIEAMTMADRIVVMRDGRVEQSGSPLELYDNPTNRFVAGFIGSPAMNFIEVRVDGQTARLHDGALLDLPEALQLADGQPIVLGIRPENLALNDQGPLQATVSVVEPTGSDTQVFLQSGDHPMMLLARERVSVRPGEAVRITPDSAKFHIFDSETGRRMN